MVQLTPRSTPYFTVDIAKITRGSVLAILDSRMLQTAFDLRARVSSYINRLAFQDNVLRGFERRDGRSL
jgi:hypothetical protein